MHFKDKTLSNLSFHPSAISVDIKKRFSVKDKHILFA